MKPNMKTSLTTSILNFYFCYIALLFLTVFVKVTGFGFDFFVIFLLHLIFGLCGLRVEFFLGGGSLETEKVQPSTMDSILPAN